MLFAVARWLVYSLLFRFSWLRYCCLGVLILIWFDRLACIWLFDGGYCCDVFALWLIVLLLLNVISFGGLWWFVDLVFVVCCFNVF